MIRMGILFLLLLFSVLPAWGGTIAPDLEARLGSLPPGEELPVIVTFADEADLTPYRSRARALRRAGVVRALHAAADRSQDRARSLLRSRGKEFRPLWIINGLAMTATEETIRELAGLPEVHSLIHDRTVSLLAPWPTVLGGTATGNLEAVGVPDLWDLGVTGVGTVIAIFDSGVDLAHPDLADNWRGGSNSWFNPYAADCAQPGAVCTPCEQSGDFPCDDVTGVEQGHGTMVAGILVGGDGSGVTIGVAPDAQWIAAKIFRDTDDTALLSAIHGAFQWALDPDGNPETDDAPDVVNNSWGFDGIHECLDLNPAENFQPDIAALEAAGIAVVFPSGNGGPLVPSDISPANYPQSFAVGAVASDLEVAAFSGRGPSACGGTLIYPAIVAPGAGIRTTFLWTGSPFNSYVIVNGTSFSAPHASGVMALLRQAFPEASPEDLKAAIRASARDLGPGGPDNLAGFGFLDALAAYRFLPLPPNSPPGAIVLDLPADGAEALPTAVTFRWGHPADPDGNPVRDRLQVSGDSFFTAVEQTREITAVPAPSSVLWAEAGGGLMALGVVGLVRKRRWIGATLVAGGVVVLLVSCGGGGGDGGDEPVVLENPVEEVLDLEPGRTYWWRVVSDDGLGGVTVSGTRRFTTGP